MSYKYSFVCVLFLLFASGCAATKAPKPVNPEPDQSIKILSSAADNIQNDINLLSQIKKEKEKSENVNVKTYGNPKSEILNKKISFSWSGPLNLALEVLSEKINYRFKQVGNKPIKDNIIEIDKQNTAIFEIIEDIGWKTGVDTILKLDEENKILQVTYVKG